MDVPSDFTATVEELHDSWHPTDFEETNLDLAENLSNTMSPTMENTATLDPALWERDVGYLTEPNPALPFNYSTEANQEGGANRGAQRRRMW